MGNIHVVSDDYKETVNNKIYNKLLSDMKKFGIYSKQVKMNSVMIKELSEYNKNITCWIPFDSRQRVLEIHSGCGTVSNSLLQKISYLECIEVSLLKSQINHEINYGYDNFDIYVGNDEVECIECLKNNIYDYVLIWGIENIAWLRRILKKCESMIKDGSKIILAFDNKYGLKYWAGKTFEDQKEICKSIESSDIGCTLKQVEEMLITEQYGKYNVYYPYPDYKTMFQMFSDDFLPQRGQLTKDYMSYIGERISLFDELEAFDGIIENNVFRFFSNSYVVVIEGKK